MTEDKAMAIVAHWSNQCEFYNSSGMICLDCATKAVQQGAEQEREAMAMAIQNDGLTVWQEAPLNTYAGGYKQACKVHLGMIQHRSPDSLPV